MPMRRRRLVGNVAQARRIDRRHVGKPDAEASSFGPDQRVVPQQIDMVVDRHQIARRKRAC